MLDDLESKCEVDALVVEWNPSRMPALSELVVSGVQIGCEDLRMAVLRHRLAKLMGSHESDSNQPARFRCQ